jgi:hypothetical protein
MYVVLRLKSLGTTGALAPFAFLRAPKSEPVAPREIDHTVDPA